MRLIDADEAIRLRESNWVYDLTDFVEFINQVPTVEAVPVIHGEWIPRDGSYYCSVCDEENNWAFNWVTGRYEYLYCPKCGAKMDGKVV